MAYHPKPSGLKSNNNKVVEGVHNKMHPPKSITSVTREGCLNYFKDFIKHEKPGLEIFYNDSKLDKQAKRAVNMISTLRAEGCKNETSQRLSILILYDVVMLIDDSSSMNDEEDGTRIKTLETTIKEITKIYDLANSQGILSIQFLNTKACKNNIKRKNAVNILKNHSFWGTTKIGWALDEKILKNFVWNMKMKKPLLVMTITDGNIEGELPGKLQRIIKDSVKRLRQDRSLGEEAVTFHFSRVGNDAGAAKLLKKLDKNCGEYVTCLSASYRLENLTDTDKKWDVLLRMVPGKIGNSLSDHDVEHHEYNLKKFKRVQKDIVDEDD